MEDWFPLLTHSSPFLSQGVLLFHPSFYLSWSPPGPGNPGVLAPSLSLFEHSLPTFLICNQLWRWVLDWHLCTDLRFLLSYPCRTPEGDAFGTNYPWAKCHALWLPFGVSRPNQTYGGLKTQYTLPHFFFAHWKLSVLSKLYILPNTRPVIYIYFFSLGILYPEGTGLESSFSRLPCLPVPVDLWAFKGIPAIPLWVLQSQSTSWVQEGIGWEVSMEQEGGRDFLTREKKDMSTRFHDPVFHTFSTCSVPRKTQQHSLLPCSSPFL